MKIIDALPTKAIQSLIEAGHSELLARDHRLVDDIKKLFKKRRYTFETPASEFPELIVTIPSSWPYAILAPLYDVHIGNRAHDGRMFTRHVDWIERTPYVLTLNGGDMIENASKLSVGAGVYEQDYDPQNQLVVAAKQLARIHHKMLCALPGNHEDRTLQMGVDIGSWLAWLLDVPYFPDFCFLTIKFASQNFRVLLHHGSGGAATPGGQMMAARKSIGWAKPFDIYWTGHTHGSKADVIMQTDFNQATQRAVERNGLVVVSPSYLKYFSTYAAKKQYPPGIRGLHAVTLRRDGRIDLTIHANGTRL